MTNSCERMKEMTNEEWLKSFTGKELQDLLVIISKRVVNCCEYYDCDGCPHSKDNAPCWLYGGLAAWLSKKHEVNAASLIKTLQVRDGYKYAKYSCGRCGVNLGYRAKFCYKCEAELIDTERD